MVLIFGAIIFPRKLGEKIEQIHHFFIICNLKIKCSTPYPTILLYFRLPPNKSKTMIKYLMYKYKLTNMKNEGLPNIASNIGKSRLRLERGLARNEVFLG